MENIRSLIEQTSQKKPLLFLIVVLMVFNVLMNAPGLPTSTPSMQEFHSGFTPFDLQAMGYNDQSFVTDLNKLEKEGRKIYRNFMLLDIFFPAVYGLTFSSLIFLVFRKKRNWLKWLFIIPLLTALMDYLENIFIAISFVAYPSPAQITVNLASLATQLKMAFNLLLIFSLLLTLVYYISGRIKKQSK